MIERYGGYSVSLDLSAETQVRHVITLMYGVLALD